MNTFKLNTLYFLKDVVEITGINQPKMQQWLRDGFVRASVQGRGSGSRNMFDFNNLCEIVLFSRLVASGLSRREASVKSQTIPSLELMEEKLTGPFFLNIFSDFSGNKPTLSTLSAPKDSPVTPEKIVSESGLDVGSYDMILMLNIRKLYTDVKISVARYEAGKLRR